MTGQVGIQIDIALIHYPVIGKRGEIIGSAVTNLDLHDIARVAKTYGIGRYYIVTPYADQLELVQEIIDHWQTGHGSTSNPARKSALSLVFTESSIEEVVEKITDFRGAQPAIVTTSAKNQDACLSYNEAREKIASGEPTLLVFGTAHGLAPEVTKLAKYTLPPIEGQTDYNHLSVRSAVSIICDRLLG